MGGIVLQFVCLLIKEALHLFIYDSISNLLLFLVSPFFTINLFFRFIILLIIDSLYISLWFLLRQFILLLLQQHLLHILCYLLMIWRFLLFIKFPSTNLPLWALLYAALLLSILCCRPIHVGNHWIIFNRWYGFLYQFWNTTLSSKHWALHLPCHLPHRQQCLED